MVFELTFISYMTKNTVNNNGFFSAKAHTKTIIEVDILG